MGEREPLSTLAGRHFDAVVVGAGVNGVSAAVHLAAAGYAVLLVEKGDFGSGSSSRSSRLLHCGLRYLAPGGSMWDFALHPGRLATALGMARKAMACRAQFARQTPERVRHFTIYFPVMEGQPYDPWQIGLGLQVLAALGPGEPPLEQRRVPLAEARQAPLIGGVREPDRLRAVMEALDTDAFAALQRFFDQRRLHEVVIDIAQTLDALIFEAELRVNPSRCHVCLLLWRRCGSWGHVRSWGSVPGQSGGWARLITVVWGMNRTVWRS